MARAQLLGLQCPAQPTVREAGQYGLASVPVHNADVVSRKLLGRVNDVTEQRPTGERLLHLR